MMSHRPRVALLIETSNSYGRGLLRGITRYVREHRPWTTYVPETGRGEVPPAWLKRWHGDGIIARIENESIARIIEQARLPTVNVSAGRLAPQFPVVETDNAAIAQAAFAHLHERGLRQFGYCGDARFEWSNLRSASFVQLASQAGLSVEVYRPRRATSERPWEQEQEELALWVSRLPKPVGIMACYDIRGRQLLDVCRQGGIAVPDQVAVIGVDNDDLLCELAEPPLSSVIPDTGQSGYVAAELLDRLLAGEPLEPGEQLIKPLGVATRHSTDVLAIDDEDLVRAVRFIRDHACEGIKVDAVLDHVAMSRRALEYRFLQRLGCSPHERIVQVQMQRVMQLLGETELPLADVAERAGFKHVEYLSVVFKRRTGLSPREFRQRSRGQSAGGSGPEA